MWILRYCLLLACLSLPGVSMALAADELYLCADGTFTNRVERQCAPYESKGVMRVQGANAAKIDEGKQSFAEVKLFEAPAKGQVRNR